MASACADDDAALSLEVFTFAGVGGRMGAHRANFEQVVGRESLEVLIKTMGQGLKEGGCHG